MEYTLARDSAAAATKPAWIGSRGANAADVARYAAMGSRSDDIWTRFDDNSAAMASKAARAAASSSSSSSSRFRFLFAAPAASSVADAGACVSFASSVRIASISRSVSAFSSPSFFGFSPYASIRARAAATTNEA
eukprot:14563-Pelagococcus_subviridis.AAC.3